MIRVATIFLIIQVFSCNKKSVQPTVIREWRVVDWNGITTNRFIDTVSNLFSVPFGKTVIDSSISGLFNCNCTHSKLNDSTYVNIKSDGEYIDDNNNKYYALRVGVSKSEFNEHGELVVGIEKKNGLLIAFDNRNDVVYLLDIIRSGKNLYKFVGNISDNLIRNDSLFLPKAE